MRIRLILLPLLLSATPALAQTRPPATPPAEQQVQRALNDPAMADRLAGAMQAMSRAFLDMPVGEIEAAVEGRPPTLADRNRTLRSENPSLDRELQTQVAQARPMMRQSMKALSDALPAMMRYQANGQKPCFEM